MPEPNPGSAANEAATPRPARIHPGADGGPRRGKLSFADRFAALPDGSFRARSLGRDWIVSKRPVAGGRGWKLVAEELGGTDYVSLNVYDLGSGQRVIPCEMPLEKVTRFVLDLKRPSD